MQLYRQGSIDNTVIHKTEQTVRDTRMRERMSMKSKMLGALALLTLIGALFVMQSAEQHTPTAEAATGSIAALNVGTCLTTDDDVFGDENCGLNGDGSGTDPVKWEVRDEITEVSTLYATYAFDPKTASDEPRVILEYSDLLKISIHDADRDKRTGVLIRAASNETDDADTDNDQDGASIVGEYSTDEGADNSLAQAIWDDLKDPSITSGDNIVFNHEIANGNGIEIYVQGADMTSSVIDGSGTDTLNFSRSGDPDGNDPLTAWSFPPMDVDGAIRLYGCVDGPGTTDGTCDGDNTTDDDATDDEPYIFLGDIKVDEDKVTGNNDGDTAPWFAVNASVGQDEDLIILAVYYETSEVEDLVGGQAYRHCGEGNEDHVIDTDGWTCDDPDTTAKETVAATPRTEDDDVKFTDDEEEDNDALVVRASSDGDDRSVNLHLRESSRFSGRYQGYLQLTDANGDGSADKNNTSTRDIDETKRQDWGRDVTHGSAADEDGDLTMEDAAVLGVESGPVTIEYKDTDGKTQRLRIEIDRQPPAIQITAPAHGTASDDGSPDFSGTIEDSDSGLTADSFRLVVDNVAEESNDGFALDSTDYDASSVDLKQGQARLRNANDFKVPTAEPFVIGVADPDIYDLGDDSCGDDDKCHMLAEDYDDGARNASFEDSVKLNLRDGSEDAETRDNEYEVDFQAFVLDQAGNIGFSDSDPTKPSYIGDLGNKDRASKNPGGNVFGYYSAHVIHLDEKDPEILTARSATGYYGRSNDENIADRFGVMVVFDGPIASSSVARDTFSVELDDESAAQIVDVSVDKQYVFLKLANELASDATPMVGIASGRKVEDMAGNETFSSEVDEFEVADGISPKLTVTLSGGSGTGTGSEGPEKLTNDQITVHVSSDEELQGAPRIVVTCSSLRWNEGEKANVRRDIDDFVANRNTSSTDRPDETPARTPAVSNKNVEYGYTCDYTDPNGVVQDFNYTEVSSLSRPGDNWEYTWQVNGSGLEEGDLTAVAFARDRSRYENGDSDMLENWGSASAEFKLDTKLVYPNPSLKDFSAGGDLQPAPDGASKEARPFVLIEFNEGTTVTLDSVELDNVEITNQFERPDHNRFLYWPLSISQGEHEVEVTATDAAGNEKSFEYSFKVEARGDFVISLNAGWNAISVPANPVDTSIGSVFTDPMVTTVIGWDTQGWRIAMRRDGIWESNEKYGALNEIRAKYGYWVKSDGFVRQAVELKGGTSRDAGGTPILISIPTEPGWNFVGVIDQDGDQTEDNFGDSLQGSDDTIIAAREYLGSTYVRAYTWDATFSRFDVVRPDHAMTIGDGVWVYYPEGTGIAP